MWCSLMTYHELLLVVSQRLLMAAIKAGHSILPVISFYHLHSEVPNGSEPNFAACQKVSNICK